MLPFERNEFESVCNFFHETGSHGTLVAPTFHTPVYYHTDTWELSGNTLTRIHKRTRATFFSPEGTKDRPVELPDLADIRTTYLEYADGRKETLTDNWRSAEFPRGKTSERFVGRTVFQLSSKPTGRKLVGKQTTIPELPALEPQPNPFLRSRNHFLSSRPRRPRSIVLRTLSGCVLRKLPRAVFRIFRSLCLSSFLRRIRPQDSRIRMTCGLTFRLVGCVCTTCLGTPFSFLRNLTLWNSLETVA